MEQSVGLVLLALEPVVEAAPVRSTVCGVESHGDAADVAANIGGDQWVLHLATQGAETHHVG